MINLLPPERKEDIRFSRYNTRLAGWTTVAIFALVGVGLIVGGGLVLMKQSSKNVSRQVAESNQKLQQENVDETKKRVDSISSNTKLVVQVLSREILFSKLLRQLGASVPADTELLSFQVEKLQGGLTLTAAAKDINSATQLQLNLQDPKNKIFEKADIENINCAGASNESKKNLPCVVQIRALFTKNNPYLYITPTGSTSTTEKKP
jgi:Tfp pilus assembly protein PilN